MAITTTGRGVSTGSISEQKDESITHAFLNLSAQDGLTAFAGGGQANAVSISSYQVSRFSTVANSGDSAKLGLSTMGFWRIIINGGFNPINVFPASGDQINLGGANAPFAVPGGKTCLFFCAPAGNWNTLLSA
jgi:hypothetical protein